MPTQPGPAQPGPLQPGPAQPAPGAPTPPACAAVDPALARLAPGDLMARIADPARLLDIARAKLCLGAPQEADRLLEELVRPNWGSNADRPYGPAALERGKLFDPRDKGTQQTWPPTNLGFAILHYQRALQNPETAAVEREARERLTDARRRMPP